MTDQPPPAVLSRYPMGWVSIPTAEDGWVLGYPPGPVSDYSLAAYRVAHSVGGVVWHKRQDAAA